MTSLELVISISIIVIISSLCFMKYENDNYIIDSFAKQLCSDIRYIRRENILDNKVYIRFINENDTWGYSLYNNSIEEKRIFLPKNTKLSYPITQNSNYIRFDRTGAYEHGGGTIIISKNSISKYITIVPVSGRVLYKEGIYEK